MAFLTKSLSLNTESPKVFTYNADSSGIVSYSAATQTDKFPTREQGLILNCIEGSNLTDYIVAIGDLIQPKNIVYATRISSNRVCLYLSNKDLVGQLTENHKYVLIHDRQVNIRPLVAKHQRVIFSNVAPPIPHYIIEDIIDSLNQTVLASYNLISIYSKGRL